MGKRKSPADDDSTSQTPYSQFIKRSWEKTNKKGDYDAFVKSCEVKWAEMTENEKQVYTDGPSESKKQRKDDKASKTKAKKNKNHNSEPGSTDKDTQLSHQKPQLDRKQSSCVGESSGVSLPSIPKEKCNNKSLKHKDESSSILERAVQRHEVSLYGQHVANELLNLKPKTCTIAKYMINNVLFEAAIGRYDDENDNRSDYSLYQPASSLILEDSSSVSMAEEEKTFPLIGVSNAKDPNKKKKPRGPYIIYCAEIRNEIKASNPELSMTQISKELGKRWNALTVAEKQTYQAKANEEKKRYLDELKEEESKNVA